MKFAAILLGLALASAHDQLPSPEPNMTPSDLGLLTSGLGDNSTEHQLQKRYCESGYGRCSRTGYCCPYEAECCVDGCGPAGTQCCRTGGHCKAGNHCYILDDGETTCCTNSACTAYVGANGVTTTNTQTFTYDVTITYYTYYYHDATILESIYQYFYTTYYIYATATAEASSSAASISESLEASLSAEYTPPPSPTLPAETESSDSGPDSYSYSPYDPGSDEPAVTSPPLFRPSQTAGSSSSAIVCVGCPGDLCSRCDEESSDDGTTTTRQRTSVAGSLPTTPPLPGSPPSAATSIRGMVSGEGVLGMVMAMAALAVGTGMLAL